MSLTPSNSEKRCLIPCSPIKIAGGLCSCHEYVMVDLPEPAGSFILEHCPNTQMGLDGAYYHHSQVCVLLNKYAVQKVRKALEELLPEESDSYGVGEKKYVIEGYLSVNLNTK